MCVFVDHVAGSREGRRQTVGLGEVKKGRCL